MEELKTEAPAIDGINGSGNETKEGQVAGARVFYPKKLEPVVRGEVPTEDSLPASNSSDAAAKPVTDDTGIIKMHVEAPRIGGEKPRPAADSPVPDEPNPTEHHDAAPVAKAEPAPVDAAETDLSGLPKGPYKVDSTEASLVVRDADGKAIAVIPQPDESASKNLADGVVALSSLKQKLADTKKQLTQSLDEVEASLAHMNEALGGAFPELVEDGKAKLETMKQSLAELSVEKK